MKLHHGLFSIIFSLMVSAHCSVWSQERCQLNISTSPEIRGLKLGMGYEQVKLLFPDSINFKYAPPANEVGVVEVSLSILDWHKQQHFEGVQEIELSFTDGKLTSLAIGYDRSTKWPSIEDFIRQLSKTLSLPAAWRNPKNADPQKARVLDCEGFRIVAGIDRIDNSFMALVDNAAEQTVKDRRAAIEEKKRQTFKP